jgi:hypothetical protein
MSNFYDNPLTITYNLGLHDFGAGGDALAIKAPNGFTRGQIRDIGVAVTETFNAVTTPAYVRLGTAADPDAYAELNMGTAADTNYYNTQDDTDAIIDATVPSATQIEVALVAPTGGTPAGIGHVHVTIDWYG